MRDLRVYSRSYGYASWLQTFYNLEIVKSIEEAELLVLPGGSDVNPAIYNEPKGSRTYCSEHCDKEDLEDWNKAMELGLPVLGICRGLQFICAINGGKLIQDVTNHAGCGRHHAIFIGNVDNKDLNIERPAEITSLHHQMVYPYNLNKKDYRILAYNETKSTHYLGGDDKPMKLPDDFVEIEVLYFPKTNALGIQGHPEMMPANQYRIVPWLAKQVDQMLTIANKKK